MNVDEILRQLKQERERLDTAIRALGGGHGTGNIFRRRGRPPGSTTKARATKGRRGMSAAARKRIADAMRKRWAAAKKSGKKRL